MSIERNGVAPLRVGLDGFNLALEQGTGIATYGRNLSYALRDLGAQIDVIYGRNLAPPSRRRDPLGSAALMQEIGFFDPRPNLEINSVPAGIAWGMRSLIAPKVVQVPISGRVVADHFRDRLPAFDRIWNSRNLFTLAHNHFNVWGVPLRIRTPNPPTVMHWTYPLPVELVGSRNVYTIHDLIPLRLPYTTLDHKRRYLKLMRMIARRADHIITVSETSRTDIMQILRIAPSGVTNTFQAAEFSSDSAVTSDAQARTDVRSAVGLPHKGYFLFFGAIEPKKNVGRLIEGFLTAGVKSPLLIVGKKAWKSEQELKLLALGERPRSTEKADGTTARWGLRGGRAPNDGEARKEKGDPRIIQLDYVPQSLLISLVKSARGVIFPSVYEGFGLPVLEAMQLGVPVITSSASSLPEVAGDAALLVDPYDPRAIAEAIRRLDGDAGLRADLAARGLRQAEHFSPAAYRERLRGVYDRLGVTLPSL